MSFEIHSPSALGDFGAALVDDVGEFTRGFWSAGIERPLNGIGQVLSLGHLPELHVYEPDANAHGHKKFAQVAGGAAGVIFDFAVLNKLSGKAVSSFTGSISPTIVERLTASALTGFAYGSLLTPLKPGESQWNRLTNGTTQAASFVAFDGFSSALATQVAVPTFLNSVARGGIAGAGAGVVHANAESLTHGHGFASRQQMLSEGTAWGTGAALMGGFSYLLSKATSPGADKSSTKSASTKGDGTEAERASLADGGEAKIFVRQLQNGQRQIESVELPNGTRMVRDGNGNRWVSNSGTSEHQAWQGDVRMDGEGKLQFIYKYEKAPSAVTVDVRLPDGSRVAVANADGSLTLPSSKIDATNQTLSDGALTSLKKLQVDVARDRLTLEGASSSESVNTHFSVQLTNAEAARVRQIVASQPEFKIVSPGQAIAQTAGGTRPTLALPENQPGEYAYDTPMSDHTASVAYMFKGTDDRWKVLTGVRKIEPEAGRTALPGGFLDMSKGKLEDPAQAVARELMEETGVKVSSPVLVRVGDAFNRDIRNRVIDFQYGVVGTQHDASRLIASDDLGDLQIKDVKELLSDPFALAFDHSKMLSAALKNITRLISSAEPPRTP